MEKIKIRRMTTFILSNLINAGIGLVFGILASIIVIIMSGGIGAWATLLTVTGSCTVFVGILAANLYHIYYYYTFSMDVNAVCEGDGVESDNFLTAFALSMVTCGFYQIYWNYKLAQRLRANAPRYGFKIPQTGKDIIILNLFSFGFIGTYEMMKNMNRIANVYNQSGLAEVGGVQ